ncbi:hypothetical protein D3C72_2181730 [compost metagenome]
MKIFDPAGIDISADNLGNLADGAVLHGVDLLKTDIHHLAYPENQQNCGGTADTRQGDMPDLSKFTGSVDFGRLVQGRVNAAYSRQIQNRSESRLFPYA